MERFLGTSVLGRFLSIGSGVIVSGILVLLLHLGDELLDSLDLGLISINSDISRLRT
jgi:hypothetical protein